MATAKNKKSASKSNQSVHNKRLVQLHELGVAKDLSARKTLTKSQQEKVRKLWQQTHLIVANKDQYVKQKLTNIPKSTVQGLKQKGYTVIGDTVFLKKQHYDTAKLVRKWDKDLGEYAIIERKFGTRKTEEEIVGSRLQEFHLMERMREEYRLGKFKPNERIGFKVFDNNHFYRSSFTDFDDAMKYAANINWNTKHASKDELEDNLHIVKLTIHDWRDFGANEPTPAKSTREKSRQKHTRRKYGTGKKKHTPRS